MNVLQHCILLLVIIMTVIKLRSSSKRKTCTLKTHPLEQTYVIKCEPAVAGRERTTIRREKKNKKGPPGPPGEKGQAGPPGPIGAMGPIGPTGVPGRRGFTGPKGPNGEKGELGPMGPQGQPGIPGNCIKDSLTKLTDNKNLFHCLPGPIGPEGRKGKEGEKGAIGQRGESGTKGKKGDQGPAGRRGAVGRPGLPGSPGIITCKGYHTEWVGRFRNMDDKAFDGFFCPAGQFLQGFKIEKEGLKERYNYVCCELR